jgi:hypothetical protein
MTPSERGRARKQRLIKLGLCITCGWRKARPRAQTCAVCAETDKARERKRRHLRPRAPDGYRTPHRCGVCGQLGHTSRTCTGAAAVDERRPQECARCSSPRALGAELCQEHLDTLAELAREGWEDECESS